LKSQGVTFIYISHRLEEIFEIADRVTILKDGKKVDTFPVKDIDREKIIRLMVGREIEIKPPAIPTKTGEVVLEIHDLCRSKELYNINLTLHKGEILGVAGLMGAGRTELARAIFGVDPPDSGKILLNHRPIRITTPLKAIHQGIALVPEDRKADGLVLIHTLKENIALPSLEARQRFGFIDGKRESQEVKKSIDELSIHAASIDQQIAYLSGGNQQKAVLAKWLNCGPDVIICDEPTRGIDVGAKAEIYNLLRSLALAGKSILMISSELTEILQLSNRIIVLSSGRVAGELAASEATEEKILELAYRNEDLQAPQTPKSATSLQSDPFQTIKNAFSKTAIQIRGIDWSNATVYALLAIIIIVGLFGSKIFFTIPNLTNLLRQAFIPFSLAIGQTLVILSGGIDLSMGSIVTVTNVLAAGLMAGQNGRVLPVALFCLSIGILFGAVNAFSVIKLHVPPIIATLGTMTIGEGAALLYTRVPIGYIPRMLSYFANGNIGRVPFSAFVLVIVLALAFVLLYKVPFGRHLYAVGGDEETSRLSGIAINRTRILAYLISGLLAAATGLYLVSRMGSGDPSVGGNLAMDAITAVLLGGTILGGGRGGLAGTTAGVLVLVVLSNVFNQMGIGSWYQEIAEGLIIIITVLIYPQSTKRV
jgi:ribose/xylose/arabinose/galactoside ABC-type transport system permease subunit/ABC-type multidrug transport system ATPase subunit